MKSKLAGLFALVLSLSSVLAHAGVNVGATRVVYQAKQKEASLSVTNSAEDNIPYLIQSWVSEYGGSESSSDAFLITPPLFRLDPGSQNMLRIMAIDKSVFASDKESLFTVNVKAIPAKSTDPAHQNVLQIAVKTSIKLFYRPEGLQGNLVDAVAGLKASAGRGRLHIQNPSGYHVVVSKLVVNGIERKGLLELIKPGESRIVDLPVRAGDTINLTYINEYGSAVEAPVKTLVN
ncbi:fimbrial biogenesis chaperone [Pseudomonas wayambapalatensis]|uniref:fimbrial biogenesis chaperone n=1 Tax=Pseudomonas wayambapalatensis TaxID=485895 RepID=UPI003CF20386